MEDFYPYIAAGIGALVGVGIALLVLWLLRRKRPHLFVREAVRDTATVAVLIGLAFAILAFAIGSTYFLLWFFYGIAGASIGYGVLTVIRTRGDSKKEKKK